MLCCQVISTFLPDQDEEIVLLHPYPAAEIHLLMSHAICPFTSQSMPFTHTQLLHKYSTLSTKSVYLPVYSHHLSSQPVDAGPSALHAVNHITSYQLVLEPLVLQPAAVVFTLP